jgi:hypothetical protein
MENNPLEAEKVQKIGHHFHFFCGKPSARPQSQAQWQRASRSFICTPLGLKPRAFLEVSVSQNGLYESVYISPAMMISLFLVADLLPNCEV